MSRIANIALAAGLVAVVSAAAAQAAPNQQARRNAPQTAQTGAYSYEAYGLGSDCSSHPFSRGCDRRGVW